MKRWPIILFISLAAFAGGLWLLAGKGPSTAAQSHTRKIRFYQDSMHPWVKSDRAGTCSICGMQLTPVFEEENRGSHPTALITLSREAVTIANVAVEPVLRRNLHRAIRVSGVLEAQESRTAIVAAPAGGRVDFIAVDHPGTEIHEGDTLVRLFSPDLAQRSRFLRVSMSNQPAASTAGGYRMDLFTSDLTAPITGIVSERPVTLGQYVMEGQKIATVIDPSVLWFRFDAFDRQLRWLVPGQQIEIRSESASGQTWAGTIALVEPVSNDLRGFAKVRAVVTNTPAGAHSDFGRPVSLRPGMFAEGRITVVLHGVLAVPKSAVVYPGSSAWVYVERHSQSYERRPIRLGQEGDDGWEILSGLKEGERVVTTGNVLVDAQVALENGDEPSPPAEGEAISTPENAGAAMDRSRGASSASDPYCSVQTMLARMGRKAD